MTTALYRRYRPESFEDVIGQEHVTEPLMTALRKDRVSHAYLFSGPRGCGKTTSARILARCLNCAEGPTATPCGRCESCRDLARDGAGSLDVIEMDAASHGGVDHARDLRERATFAPVRDRYKIFIIDEAHMVTREGFNALLKIVEEPPEHIKFIFATTEPSKVLTTIRSRTHHYPFRLVPTEPLMHYLERLCAEENVPVAPGVLSLVVRAGGGSVRDTLSVLDQLMAGSDEGGIGYDLAVALLGYTHGALLDDVVDAFASGDAATVFRAVDRVVQTGQDPRRFVEDLLERFRDLIIVDAVPESAGNILHGMPQDQIARLRNQASQLGAAELSRAADITNTALTEMTGATSPQLHLELLCARVLLPSSEDTTRGVTARVDRLERRLSIGRGTAAATGRDDQHVGTPDPAEPAPRAAAERPAEPEPPRTAPADDARRPGTERAAAPEEASAPAGTAHRREQTPATAGPGPEPEHEATRGHGAETSSRSAPADALGTGQAPRPARGDEAARRPSRPETPEPPRQDTPLADEAGDGIDMLRASWPEIVNALADIRRVAWFTVQRGTPQSFDGRVLRIMFDAEGDLMNFPRFEDDLRQAVQQILGIDCRAEAIPSGGGHGRGGTPRPPEPPTTSPGGRRAPGSGSDGTPRSGAGSEVRGRGGSPAPSREHAAQQRPSGQPHEPQRRPAEPGRSPAHPTGHEGSPAHPTGQDGPPGGQGAWSAHGRPATDAPAEWTDPAWAEEPVHSWSVAAIPQGGDETPEPTAAPTGPATEDARAPRPAPRPEGPPTAAPPETGPASGAGEQAPSRPAPGAAPGGGAASDPRTGPTGTPSGTAGSSAPGSAPGRSAARGAAAPDPRSGSGGRPAGLPQHVRHDDVPPPEEPPDLDEPPYPEDPDEAPPEQWRPAPAAQRGTPAGGVRDGTATAPGGTASPHSPAGPSAPSRAVPAERPAGTPSRPEPTVSPAVEDAAGERLSFRERHAAAIAAGRQAPAPASAPRDGDVEWDDAFVPSSDDEALEDSTLYGRAAIERILGGTLVEERDLHTGD